MTVRLRWVMIAAVLVPAGASAQVLNGTAEWTVVRGSNVSEGQAVDTNSFWQSYRLGYSTPVISPYLMKCNAEGSFQTSSLSFGAGQSIQEGRQRTVGYNVGASVLPLGPSPFFVQAARSTVGESGAYPTSSPIRGGLYIPLGSPQPDFQTLNTTLSLGWQLNMPRLPQVEVGYRAVNSVVTGGGLEGQQDNSDLHANASYLTARTRQSLRYQRNAFEDVFAETFNQRLTDLAYDLGATLTAHTQMTIRSGYRTSYSLFDAPSQIVDPGTVGYRPPTRGDVSSTYFITQFAYRPNTRLSTDVSASFDRTDAAPVATDARLLSGSTHYEALPGLSLSLGGLYGTRGQIVQDVPVNALTESADAGATYRAGVRWLQGSVGYSTGIGRNTTPDGQTGKVRAWGTLASLSLMLPWFSVSGGYDRSRSVDAILDFGNFETERVYASAQRQTNRLQIALNADNSQIARGRGVTFATSRQQTSSATLMYPFRRNQRVGLNGGGFTNRSDLSNDRTFFYGGTYEAEPTPAVRLSAWLRREQTTATQNGLDQRSLNAFAQVQYRLRQFLFAVEYRRADQDLRYAQLVNPYRLRGHQVQLRISRTFGIRF